MTGSVPLSRASPTGSPGLSLEVGDHVCALYRGHNGRDEILLPFLESGLDAGDKCITILDEADPKSLVDHLATTCDLAAALRNHQLEIRSSQETYLESGGFSKLGMLNYLDRAVGAAVTEDGFRFARATGEMTWALRDPPGVEALVEYESELNLFLPEYPQVIVCLYELDRFDGRLVVDLLRTHPKLLICGSLIDNPYYQAPEVFLQERLARLE